MCVLEAMACSCPVITIKGAGAAEIVQHGIQGFIAERRDPEEYASYISKILENDALSKRMSLEAWKTALSYSWENHARKIANLCENLLHLH
jgi:glycosyltransferase involved in cell wall biosynthesis